MKHENRIPKAEAFFNWYYKVVQSTKPINNETFCNILERLEA